MLLFMAVVWITFKNVGFLPIVKILAWQDVLLNMLLGLVFFVSFGLVMFVGFRLHYKLSIQPVDVITLPLMMHFFTYLVPLKGGLLFQIFYSRSKYQLELSKGFSLGIIVFLISVLLTVTVGLGISFNMQPVPEVLTSVLGTLGLGLVAFPVVLGFFPATQRNPKGLLGRFVNFLSRVRQQLAMQVKNVSLLFWLTVSTLFSVLIQSLWYLQSTHMLGIEATFVTTILMVLFLRIFLLVRLLPGNLGVQELVIGLVFSAAGFTLDQGLLVALIIRLVSVILAATIGLAGLYSNLQYFNTGSISGLVRSVTGNKER